MGGISASPPPSIHSDTALDVWSHRASTVDGSALAMLGASDWRSMNSAPKGHFLPCR